MTRNCNFFAYKKLFKANLRINKMVNLKTGGRAKSRKVFMKKVMAQAKRDKRRLNEKYS